MPKAPIQTIIDTSQDAALNIYATNNQTVPAIGSANVVITNTTQYITEIFNLKASAAGNVGEIEFNDGSGLAADTGLTYDAATDSLTVAGNVFAGNIRTDNLKYSNGTSYNFSGSSYSNSNVGSFLPTYSGTLTASAVVSSGNSNAATFNGSGAGLSNLPAANVIGTVANANYALYSYQAWGVDGSNVTGYVPNATHATIANTANAVAGANVSGTVASATNASTATTVTANAQPNITSIGTLSSLTVSANVAVGNISTTGNANVARFNVSTTANLGAVGNVTITGGSTGQYLQTDGSGHLSWTTVSATTSNLQQVTTQGGSTDQAIVITNNTTSVGYTTGALKVTGGVGVGGDVFVQGHVAAHDALYAGQYASYSSFTLPKFIGRDAGSAYIQGALINTNGNGSADWVAYGDISTDSVGWADMGYTGSTFNDPAYTITKASDGYFFVQGLDGYGGNLVLATGDLGGAVDRDIIFATGGFLIENEKMRLNHEDSTLYVGGHAHVGAAQNVTNIDINGNTTARKNVTVVASHANLVFGDATSSSGPGMSSTDSMAIVTNRGTSDKAWYFNTDGSLSVPGSIIPSANVSYDLGSSTSRFKDLWMGGTTNLGAVGNVKITGGTAGQVLTTDGAGNLSFTTASSGGGVPAGSGTTAYSDVWVLSTKGADAGFWTSYSLTGNLLGVFGSTDVTGLSSQTVYGKQIASGSKTLVVNDGTIQSNSYGIVIEFPSSPSVGDTFASPVVGGTSVSKLIFKPASGQKAYGMGGGGGPVTAFGSGTSYIGCYVDISGMGTQPITWAYAGSISGTPTWYQMYF